MKEFIEKLIGMLEELYARNDKTKKMAYEEKDWEKFDLFTHRCEGIYSAISIVNQLAEEYKLSEMQTGWIACSERLPEVSGEYYTYVYYDGHYMYSVDEIDCDGIIKEWNCSPDYQIIAWKPIEFYQPIGE